ncbi:MAG: hypothetical protein QXQ79_02170 [Candidatus Nanoarchaeia archaeon]
MVLRKPTANDKFAYFTKRAIGNGKIVIWRFEGDNIFNIEYTCPHCGKSGEKQEILERQKITIKENNKRKQTNAYIIKCDFCGKEIIVEQWAKKRGRK